MKTPRRYIPGTYLQHEARRHMIQQRIDKWRIDLALFLLHLEFLDARGIFLRWLLILAFAYSYTIADKNAALQVMKMK